MLFACSFCVLYTSPASVFRLHSVPHKMASRSKAAAPAAVKKPPTAPKKVKTGPGCSKSDHQSSPGQSCLHRPLQIIDSIKEATGAQEEEISAM